MIGSRTFAKARLKCHPALEWSVVARTANPPLGGHFSCLLNATRRSQAAYIRRKEDYTKFLFI